MLQVELQIETFKKISVKMPKAALFMVTNNFS